MDASERQALEAAIHAFAKAILHRAQAGLSEGTLRPEEWPIRRKIVAPLAFDDRGFVQGHQWNTELTTRPIWLGASRRLLEGAVASPEYAAILASAPSLDADKVRPGIEALCHRILPDTLNRTVPTTHRIGQLVGTLADELAGIPIQQGATVRLLGLGLQLERIDLSDSADEAVLRRTRASDYEQETDAFLDHPEQPWPAPSCVLELKYRAATPFEIQKRVEQAVAVLRLLMVASIVANSYELRSASLLHRWASSARFGSGTHINALTQASLSASEVERVQLGWRTLIGLIPERLYWPADGKVDSLLIAYQRYCDALLVNGILERRVANAAMGLESLFMKEKDLIGYRLGLRAARVLAKLDIDPVKAKREICDAYDIRSAFVHGDTIRRDQRRKLEKRYGALDNLLTHILYYLRTAILTIIVADVPKKEFIALVDDSFLLNDKADELGRLANGARQFVSPCR